MTYDILVIGGGPGGCKAAELAGKAGLKVVLFEKEQLGGVCLNHGCVPTKSLLFGVKLYTRIKYDAPMFGISTRGLDIDPAALWQRSERTMNRLRSALRCRLEDSHVEIVSGEAQWERKPDGVFSVSCNEQLFHGRHLILATGGRPVVPQVPGMQEGLQSGLVVTPRNLLEKPVIPRSLIILGGGTIGMEFATIYSGLGTQVTVVEKAASIGGGVDERISAFLLEVYRKHGVTFRLNTTAASVAGNGLVLQSGGLLEADKILLACGWESLPLEGDLSDVHVIGDANGRAFLAPVAEREAEVAVKQISGQSDTISYNDIPHVIFTNPEVACWGKTLAQAKVSDPNATEEIRPLSLASRYAIEHPTENGFGIKVYSGKGTLIGVHLAGTGVVELLSRFTKKMPHPSLGEFIV